MTSQLWFPRDDYVARVARVQSALAERGLDGAVLFEPESVTWLTGFFTRAYTGFQFALLPAAGEPLLICRDVSAYYVGATFAFSKCVHWSDGEDKDALTARVIRDALGAAPRLGVEKQAWRLDAGRYQALQQALPRVALVDLGKLLREMRLIKSPAEIAYQRQAARAAEAGMKAGVEAAKAGNSERDVAAAVCAAMVTAGSDTPGPGVLSSGERARHLHGGYTERVLEPGDTLQLETTPHVRHYHARFMRTMKVGGASPEERATAQALLEVQDRAIAETGPDVPAGVPDRIYRDGIVATGLVPEYTNKTFYSIGLMMSPTDSEPLEATPGATWRFSPGMVFHTYLLAGGFGFSETVAITPGGCERLTTYPRVLIET